jgi:hypothetical protein
MDQTYENSHFALARLGGKDEYSEIAIQTILKYDSADGNIAESGIIPYASDEEELYTKENFPSYPVTNGKRSLHSFHAHIFEGCG